MLHHAIHLSTNHQSTIKRLLTISHQPPNHNHEPPSLAHGPSPKPWGYHLRTVGVHIISHHHGTPRAARARALAEAPDFVTHSVIIAGRIQAMVQDVVSGEPGWAMGHGPAVIHWAF